MDILSRLTPDLTMDILSRLPVRSLLRAKCVCKSWHTLASDPILSTLHLNQSSINNDAIVVTFPKHLNGRKEVYFSEQPSLSEENISLFTKKIHLSFINGTRKLRVIGSCNGLLCLAKGVKSVIHIFNPVTGEHQQLPDFRITCGMYPTYDDVKYKYCFGFDDCKNVFKVVVFFPRSKINKVDVNVMQIWTVGDNRWRRQLDTDILPNVFSLQTYFNAFVNGFLHLIGTNRKDSENRIIVVSFHLDSEDLEVIQTPDSIALKNYSSWCFALGVIDNCLSFVDASNDGFVEIWLRKIENGFFSWIKTFSFSIQREISDRSSGGELVFLKYTKDGELLLQFYNRLLSYNAKTNTCKIFEIRDQEQKDIPYTKTFPFVGSLISFKSQA